MTARECIALRPEEEEQFFDSTEDISTVSDSCPGSPANNVLYPNDDVVKWARADPRFQVSVENLESVQERRDKFMRWMGLDLPCSPCLECSDQDGELTVDSGFSPDMDRMTSDCGAVLRSLDTENDSSMSTWSNEIPSMSEDAISEENYECRIKNLDDGSVFVLDVSSEDGNSQILREVGSNRMVTLHEFERNFGPSAFVQQLMRREDSSSSNSDSSVRRRRKMGWLTRLRSAACIVNREREEIDPGFSDFDQGMSGKVQRVRVCPCKKRYKELSAVYKGQDIKAHDGAILTMKFSPDGEYLASGGKDGVVRVWRVMECERTAEGDVAEDDPSCIYFSVNHNSELVPLSPHKEKKGKSRGIRRISDSACIVIPPEVFRISEKPVQEFYGHDGDVLDLSWSKNKFLLTSSIDKTVRLWQVGFDGCLKVFPHNNYVTCIQFNPIDENYFISGSIDGKIRTWNISACRVVDWADIKDIVTAVCYRPDGKGCVVGSMAGSCQFYEALDNHLQLDAKVSLQGRKKSCNKRITGFEFCPSDHRKLMVTSADSLVRILDGVEVVAKYKGLKNAGSQISASFTSDGQHIVSASEDSNVYVWNHNSEDAPSSHQVKSTWSCERFSSRNVSIAIPWNGLGSRNPLSVTTGVISRAFRNQYGTPETDSLVNNTVFLSPSGSFTLSHEFFSEFMPKGSATWPEEKLPSSSVNSTSLCKSHYKLLKTSCQNSSHAWGQVIVTAGWDGRIRSFQNYGLPVHL